MRIFVEAKANARKEYVERVSETSFRVGVRSVPEKGKANAEIAEALAGFFGVSRSRVTLRSGASSKRKVFDIL